MIKIKSVSYNIPQQERILEACLREWFRNPKDLNLTSPNSRYPFNFKHWKQKNYSGNDYITCVVEQDDWIIGHGSIRLYPEENRSHIFHVIISPEHRRQGYAERLIEHLIKVSTERDCERVTLYVNPANSIAIKIYEKLGFKVYENPKKKFTSMEKSLL